MKSTTTEVKQKINAHILSYFGADHYGNNAPALDNLRDQMKSFDYMPTTYAGGKYMAEGGTFLVYYTDQRDFLNSLGINPDGKEYPDHKVFEQYCHLIGRQVAELVGGTNKMTYKYQTAKLCSYNRINGSVHGNPNFEVFLQLPDGSYDTLRSSNNSSWCYGVSWSWVGERVDYHLTRGGRIDVMKLNKGIVAQTADHGQWVCPNYNNATALPDEAGNCSLCGAVMVAGYPRQEGND